MSLEEYKKKRRFSKTPEPEGEAKRNPSQKLIYAIQKHDALHLHYDLRLEIDGVLRSWAVPKEPPKEEGTKRLAVETEDHPVGYEQFEGTIPEGEYGAGTVQIWDKGSYELEEIKDDRIIFNINGKKLYGVYCLIKLKPKERGDKNWLFFKKKNHTKIN